MNAVSGAPAAAAGLLVLAPRPREEGRSDVGEAVALEPVEVAELRWESVREALPPEVRDVFERHGADLERWEAAQSESLREWLAGPEVHASWSGEFLRWNLHRPGRPSWHVYGMRGPTLTYGHQSRVVFVHDPETRRVTPEPFELDAQWIEMDEGPVPVGGLFPRQADLELDGDPEIVVRHVMHNGTVTQLVSAVCLAVGPDLR